MQWSHIFIGQTRFIFLFLGNPTVHFPPLLHSYLVIDVSAVFDEYPGALLLSQNGGHGERRAAFPVGGVGRGAPLQKELRRKTMVKGKKRMAIFPGTKLFVSRSVRI